MAVGPGASRDSTGEPGLRKTIGYLKALLHRGPDVDLIGCDLVETVPHPHTQVNEYTAARLLLKIVAYRFGALGSGA